MVETISHQSSKDKIAKAMLRLSIEVNIKSSRPLFLTNDSHNPLFLPRFYRTRKPNNIYIYFFWLVAVQEISSRLNLRKITNSYLLNIGLT